MFQSIGELIVLFWQSLLALPRVMRQRTKVFEQFFEIGNASLLMACVLSLFIGGVLALQAGTVLAERGMAGLIGGMVGVSMCKELGPTMMAILIAGRIGSAMAAEIGSMRTNQEIDALRTMNINPIDFLVMPRILAIAFALPMLVIFADLVGWLGGAIVCAYNHRIDISFEAYFNNLRQVVTVGDVVNGLIKSFAFAIVIGTVSCHQGLQTIGGPRGVGRTVTKAVVNSIVLILTLDYFLTRLLLHFQK